MTALARLTSDRAHYEDLSRRSREAALAYTANLNVGPFENFLREVASAGRSVRASSPPRRSTNCLRKSAGCWRCGCIS